MDNIRTKGVRIIHNPSGARGESRTPRSQLENKKNILTRLANSTEFKIWVNRVAFNVEDEVKKRVDKLMDLGSIKVEGIDENGKWQEIV